MTRGGIVLYWVSREGNWKEVYQSKKPGQKRKSGSFQNHQNQGGEGNQSKEVGRT